MSITLEKFAAESILFDLDCTDNLAPEETIVGTPAMTFYPALTGVDALTFGTPVINEVALRYADGKVGKVGGVIQIRISGGTSSNASTQRIYSVLSTFSTSTGNTLVARMKLSILSNQ
jgi:hypothetical protein